MTDKEVYKKLKSEFGEDKVTAYVENDAGDNWIQVTPAAIAEVCTYMRDQDDLKFDGLQCLSGVDWKDRLGVVYHVYSYALKHKVVLHVDVTRPENPMEPSPDQIESVTGVWPTANWHEREAHDMVGVQFVNHPDMRRILCPDDWEGWPLRKDYQVQEFYRGMPVPYPADQDPDSGGTVVFADRIERES